METPPLAHAALDDPRIIRLCQDHRDEVLSALPAGAAELVAVTSLPAVLRLVAHYGGTSFYIPSNAEGSALADVIGPDEAAALERRFGRGTMCAPAPETFWRIIRRILVRGMRESGESVNTTARALGIHARTVERIVADEPESRS